MIKIYEEKDIDASNILKRDLKSTAALAETVSQIIENVRAKGDEAIKEYNQRQRRFGGV